MTKKLLVLNLFGGPGCGKSTTATGVFHELKKRNIKSEYVHEYAKDLTWDENFNVLQNGIYVLAKQYHKIWRLQNKVDIVVTDSPLLLNMIYNTKHHNVCRELFDEFENHNYFITRSKEYLQYGRTQTLDQAKEIDTKVKNVLEGYPYEILDYSTAVETIVSKYKDIF